MPIPNSRSGRSNEGRGYPRPPSSRPPTNDYNDRPREAEGMRRGPDDNFERPVRRVSVERPPVPAPTPPPVAPIQPKLTTSQFVLTDDLRELLKIVADSDLTEVLVENAGWKIQIKREKQAVVVEYAAPAHSPVTSRPGQVPSAGSTLPAAPSVEENYHKITAPMVGIFYRSPDPKARAFLQEGELVEKGQVIGIIEAMKIMNEITSEHSGRCVRVNVENGQPVEYGQTLFLLEPA